MSEQTADAAFRARALDPTEPLAMYGLVPPPQTLAADKVARNAERNAAVLSALRIDAFVIYDVQEEEGRDGTPRAFPYTPSIEPRDYLALMRAHGTLPRPVLYRAACSRPAADFEAWLRETIAPPHSVHDLVLVGRSASDGVVPGFERLVDGIKFVEQLQLPLALGGVTLPERHRVKLNEHQRLCEKQTPQHLFFVSQVVYNADLAIMLIRDYAAECKAQGVTPCRIVFCFASISRKSVLKFMRWLGVEVPEGTAARIITAESPVDESVNVCVENFAKILKAVRTAKCNVPVGFLCESVSRFKNDGVAARRMVDLMNDELAYHCALMKQQAGLDAEKAAAAQSSPTV